MRWESLLNALYALFSMQLRRY